MKKKKIGIFGGSFNPIHKGHLNMANLAVEELQLDKLYIVPVGKPSHRCDKEFAEGKHRLNMISLIASKNPKFCPCDYEVNAKQTSYTYDTLLKIREKHPESEIYEIIGEDSAEYLHTWKNYDCMKKICDFVFFKRKGYKSINEHAKVIDAPLFEVSSTLIRKKISENKNLDDYLEENIIDYIEKNNLYR